MITQRYAFILPHGLLCEQIKEWPIIGVIPLYQSVRYRLATWIYNVLLGVYFLRLGSIGPTKPESRENINYARDYGAVLDNSRMVELCCQRC